MALAARRRQRLALLLVALPVVPAAESLGSPLEPASPPLADGCARVYLDVGSNLGVQIRKLFEAEKYPGAAVLPYFDQMLGPPETRRQDGDLCAFGFEPSPALESRLRALEAAYVAQGWRVRVFTRTLVGTQERAVPYYYYNRTLASLYASRDGGNLRKGTDWEAPSVAEALEVDFARFLAHDIGLRRIPPRGGTPRGTVVMKLDIEGAEVTLLPHLMRADALCPHVDLILAEWHGRFQPKAERLAYGQLIRRFQAEVKERYSNGTCRTRVLEVDDETYAMDDGRVKIPWGTAGKVEQDPDVMETARRAKPYPQPAPRPWPRGLRRRRRRR